MRHCSASSASRVEVTLPHLAGNWSSSPGQGSVVRTHTVIKIWISGQHWSKRHLAGRGGSPARDNHTQIRDTPDTKEAFSWNMGDTWHTQDTHLVHEDIHLAHGRRAGSTDPVHRQHLHNCLWVSPVLPPSSETPSLDRWSDWQPNIQALKKNQTCPVQARQGRSWSQGEAGLPIPLCLRL